MTFCWGKQDDSQAKPRLLPAIRTGSTLKVAYLRSKTRHRLSLNDGIFGPQLRTALIFILRMVNFFIVLTFQKPQAWIAAPRHITGVIQMTITFSIIFTISQIGHRSGRWKAQESPTSWSRNTNAFAKTSKLMGRFKVIWLSSAAFPSIKNYFSFNLSS